MIMSCNKLVKTIVTALLFCSYIDIKPSKAQLEVGFYNETCSIAEDIVRIEFLKAFFEVDRGVAAGLVRLHFHDCFVRGCDGSVLIDSTALNNAEKDAPPNNPSLRGFEVIDNAKAIIEEECEGVVSCADILAFAARDSIQFTGGLYYDVPAGRRDGRVSLASEALTNLPPPTFNLTQLTQSFATNGLTQDEMVTLSGAHTIGQSHCTSFVERLYNFSANASQDPTLDLNYATRLKLLCPRNPNPSLVVSMDRRTPFFTDVGYYKGVMSNKGLFASDQALLSSPQTRNQVVQNVLSPLNWHGKFVDAMVKMGKIGVMTGSDGEIRTNCRVIN